MKNVIDARSLALGSVHFVGMARDCDQHAGFKLLIFTKKPCEMNSIQPGHSKVQQNYVREMSLCGFEGCFSVISDMGFVTMCAKQTAKSIRRVVRVINDENARQICIGRRTLTSVPCIV